MSDFKSMAKTGKDFAVILYERVAEYVENTIVEIWLDGMKMKTILCEVEDNSLTLQPLPSGHYRYVITQIQNESIFKSDGTFSITQESDNNADIIAKLEKIEASLNETKNVKVINTVEVDQVRKYYM